MVDDIWPGSDSDGEPNSSYPDYLTAMAGKLTSMQIMAQMDMNFGFMIHRRINQVKIQEWFLIFGREVVAVIQSI